MKAGIVFLSLIVSVNTLALSFITADDVKAALSADFVIEVDANAVTPLFVGNAACEERAQSKSANAFVVENAYETALYVTSEGIEDLKKCAVLY